MTDQHHSEKLNVSPGADEPKGHLLSALEHYLKRHWRGSYVGSKVSGRFVRFAVVGGLGVFVNLVAMALLMRLTGCRDWRASSAASLVAALHNYVLNNGWTFRDRRRTGRALLNGAFVYLPMAAVGIAVTALIYSILAGVQVKLGYAASSWYLLGAQLIAILFGTYLNYTLNDSFTWRTAGRGHIKIATAAPTKDTPG